MRGCTLSILGTLRLRAIALLAVTMLLVTSCGGDERADPGPGDGGSTPTTTGDEPPGSADRDESADDDEPIRHGQFWTREVIGRHTAASFYTVHPQVIDDELWVLGHGSDGSTILRNDGAGWYQTATGAGTLAALASDGNGTIVGVGTRQKEAVVHLSTDGGSTWRSFEPPAMATPANAETFLEGVVHRPGEFLAIGTVRGADWHARVWSSADGESWTLRSELRGDGHPMSARTVLADSGHVVVGTVEHVCSDPHVNSSAGGWYLGATWLHHLRVHQGSDASALTLAGEGDHPLAAPPLDLDCDESIFDLAKIPYPDATGAMVGGTITMVERPGRGEPDGPQRVARLIDGTWQVDEIPDEAGRVDWTIIDVDGEVALATQRSTGSVSTTVLMPDGAGDWELVESGRQILNTVFDMTWHDGALIAVGHLRDEPFNHVIERMTPYDVIVLRSTVDPSEIPRCEPGPGADCASVMAERIAGYPDLSGVDFSGADLTGADLGAGSYDGASFVDAILVGAVTPASIVDYATFDGADFSGATLQGAELTRVDGAVFTGADLSWSTLVFGQRAPTVEGANLRSASLRVSAPITGPSEVNPELSLAGTDLTSTRISGPSGEGSMLRITDLTGAILDATAFNKVDLTGLHDVDLSGVGFDDASICPDGEPPVDRSCVRG